MFSARLPANTAGESIQINTRLQAVQVPDRVPHARAVHDADTMETVQVRADAMVRR